MTSLALDAAVAAAASGAPPPSARWPRPPRMVDPIGLDELIALAELQTRVDRKYFVPAEVFQQLISELADEMRVLEIDGRRTFGYESVYFDTPQLSTYRAHLQRRRQRFKARTRTYTDTGLTHVRGQADRRAGETVKQRVPLPGRAPRRAHRRGADPPGQRAVPGLPPGPAGRAAADAGHHLPAHHVRLPHRCGPADLRRRAGLPRRRARGPRHRHHVLVESKSSGRGSAPDRILRELGVRPASVSKYCVGVAALHPELPSNPWHQTLRRYFEPLPAPPDSPTAGAGCHHDAAALRLGEHEPCGRSSSAPGAVPARWRRAPRHRR